MQTILGAGGAIGTEADLARIALEAAGVPSVVVGIGVGMEGGVEGVQLLVPDDRVEAALALLGDA